MSDHKHRYKAAYRRLMIFAGILTCLLIITLPLGIWFIVLAVRGRAEIAGDQLVVKHFRTRTIRFDDVQRFGTMSVAVRANAGGGILGALIGGFIARKVYGGKTLTPLRGPRLRSLGVPFAVG